MKTSILLLSFIIGISLFVSRKSIILILQVSEERHTWEKLLSSRTSTNDEGIEITPTWETTLNEAVTFSTSMIPPTFTLPEYTFFILLVLQVGCQPILIKLFLPTTIVRTTAVLGVEGTKLIASIVFLVLIGDSRQAFNGWNISDSILAAGIPAGLFVIQNYCNLMANQILPPVTYIVLNQSKTLSTAWCCFVLMGQRQSTIQMFALTILLFSTFVVQKIVPLPCPSIEGQVKTSNFQDNRGRAGMEDGSGSESEEDGTRATSTLVHNLETSQKHSHGPDDTLPLVSQVPEQESDCNIAGRQLTMGFLPALCASFLSGLAGTLAQKSLQDHHRSPHVFNMELACFSVIFLLASLAAGSPDCQKMKENGVRTGWTLKSWIPIVSSGFGGILVGLVTKYHGAVFKSFSMIFGMVISAILQQVVLAKEGKGVTKEQLAGAAFGALSLYLHASYPPSIQAQ